jgi:hypothetical protein
MEINQKSESAFYIYEESELGILVAIHKTDQSIIKKYWKSKGEKDASASISGHPFIQDEEQGSLKIDFSQEQQFLISNLSKFN